MAFSAPKAMSEKDFYEHMATIDGYIKPASMTAPAAVKLKKEATVFDAVKAG